ncbi:inverse autotransporter beta domain-containing protein [Kalamiella sp. sgz302252]|uniref:inverse autotransporter beta domain-containing protein n=1 Tax=Pantoea sp. sgz302252 TaxID=3341827 RepID=UPI0036D31052
MQQSETVKSVAQKYNISLETLRKLNQFRTFARGFDHLQPGDELDVPRTPLPAVKWHDEAPAEADNTGERKAASLAASSGAFLASRPNKEAAASLARGMATGAANAEIQQWLGRFGTASVQLDADKNLSLKNSRLDLLLPLSDQQHRLFFTQGSVHRTDDRAQANLGLGLRHFAEEFMAGVNAFLDYDLSRNHARSGFGLEYWRDFIKLGVNGYMGLTNWKNSPDFADYQERPANGWDIRTEAYLPAIPHLGAKLNYEKYYGKEVALFGKDNRQKNPQALTAGVTLTPFPLLTLSAERQQGKDNQVSHQIGAQLNYQLGVPWHKQTDSSEVAAMRSLAGSRYDLVDRNNNIVLQYRKNEVIKLKAASLIKGYAGEQKSLNVSVNSKYALSHIDWSAANLIANGGKVIANGPADFSVVLPDYQYGEAAVNNYVISGVAVDEKGNVSRKAEVQITVTEAAISQATSTLTPTESQLPADGKAQQTLTLEVKDSQGKPVDIKEEEIAIKEAAQIKGFGADISAFKRQAIGQYTAVLTAGVHPQNITVTPAARDVAFSAASVKLIANSATAQIDSLTVVNDNAIANGQAQNLVKVVVKDKEGNPVPQQPVALTADNEASVIQAAVTDEKGEVIVAVSSLKAGVSKISVSTADKPAKSIDTNFIADVATASLDALEIIENGAIADGKAVNKIKVSMHDASGNPVPNQSLSFSVDNSASVVASAATDKQGEVVVPVSSLKAGEVTFTAHADDNQTRSVKIIFVADAASALIGKLEIIENNAAANGQKENRVRVTITDSNGNPVPEQTVNFTADNSASVTPSLTTDNSGEAEAVVTSLKAGLSNITALMNDNIAKSVSVLFVADDVTASLSKFEVVTNNAVADGTAENKLQLLVTDANGNPVANRQVKLTADSNVQLSAVNVTTNKEGTATVSAASVASGRYSITADLDGSSLTSTVDFIPGEVDATHSAFTIDKNIIAADGADAIRLSFTARDKNNNLIKDAKVTFVTTGLSQIQLGNVSEEKEAYTALLTASGAGIGQVTVLLDGKEISGLKAQDIGVYQHTLSIAIKY